MRSENPNTNFIVYKSSAGSGKTYTLVKEYLRIALNSKKDSEYQNILAITFTNKAANEMKERLLYNLVFISKNENSKHYLVLDYCKSFSMTFEDLSKRAKRVYQHMLHDFSQLHITTIDKFMTRIIRSFSINLNLSPDFDIIVDQSDNIKQSIDLVINETGLDESLSSILYDFAFQKINEGNSWNIERDIYNYVKNIFFENNYEYLRGLKDLSRDSIFKFKDQLEQKKKLIEQTNIRIAKSVLDKLDTQDIQAKDLKSGTKGFWGVINRISTAVFSDYNKPLKFTHKAYEEGSFLKKENPEIDILLNSAYEEIFSKQKEYNLISILLNDVYNLLLINSILKNINWLKQEDNALFISDFNQIINEKIKNEPTPFIYEKIGTKFNHYLIDEFQDTSVMQWQNIIPLVHDSLAQGYYNLIVGDAKQSIYKWRGGEVSQFIKLPEIYQKADNKLLYEYEKMLEYNYHEQVLESNYRSDKKIIEFVNELFNNIKSRLLPEKLREVYKDVIQKSSTDVDKGYVSVEFIKSENGEELDDLYISKTIQIINNCIERGYEMKDVAIILRTHKDGITLSKALIDFGLNVVSSKSLLLKNNENIQFIINTLKFIQTPNDDEIKLKILLHLSDDVATDLKTYVQDNNVNLEAFLESESIKLKVNELLQLPLYELITAILFNFNLDVSDTYIQSFLSIILKQQNEGHSLYEFLEYWNQNIEEFSLQTSEDYDAIKILTIHQSKGLQYPIVIHPYCNWVHYKAFKKWVNIEEFEIKQANISLSKSNLQFTNYDYLYDDEYEKALLESINMLYVALTRAKNELYLLSDDKRIKDSKYISYFLYEVISQWEGFDEDNIAYSLFKKEKKIGDVKEKKEDKIEINPKAIQLLSDNPDRLKVAGELTHSTNQYGNTIHLLLSKINDIKDIDLILEQALSQGIIPKEEYNKYEKDIKSIFENNQIKEWYSVSNAYNEIEVLYENKVYRIDRLIMLKDKNVIIDFKTGKEDEKHQKQLNQYTKMIQEISPLVVEKYLVYTSPFKIVKIA